MRQIPVGSVAAMTGGEALVFATKHRDFLRMVEPAASFTDGAGGVKHSVGTSVTLGFAARIKKQTIKL